MWSVEEDGGARKKKEKITKYNRREIRLEIGSHFVFELDVAVSKLS